MHEIGSLANFTYYMNGISNSTATVTAPKGVNCSTISSPRLRRKASGLGVPRATASRPDRPLEQHLEIDRAREATHPADRLKCESLPRKAGFGELVAGPAAT
jgi:hypothetical protein